MTRLQKGLTKKRGRPAGGEHEDFVGLRLPQGLTASIDRWAACQPDPKPTRSEAMRRLLQRALGNDLEEQITEVKQRLAIPEVEMTASPAKGMEKLRRGLAENELRTLRQKRTFTKPPKEPKS
jgi:hypothetical protein